MKVFRSVAWWLTLGRWPVRAACVRCGNRQENVWCACNHCGCPALCRSRPFKKDTTI